MTHTDSVGMPTPSPTDPTRGCVRGELETGGQVGPNRQEEQRGVFINPL